MSEIMKIIDERETHTRTYTKQRQKRTRGTKAIVKGWGLNDFVVHLGVLQLICKASLIFKSNLELILSIILKERELHKCKHVAVECRCFKNMSLVILFEMFLSQSYYS